MGIIAIVAVEAAIDVAGLVYRALTQKHEPLPPLRDLSYMTSTAGAPVPFGYGQCRVPGNVIWSSGIAYSNHGSKKSSSGPGVYYPEANLGVNYGPSGTYVFSTNVAVAFGEGPAQILRIWGDSKLIYDANPAAPSDIPLSDYPTWSSTQTYNPGNQVTYIGQVWQAIATNLNSAPSFANINWLNISPYPAWMPGTEYFPGDIVSRGGTIWVAQTQMNNGSVGPQDPLSTLRFTVNGPNGNYSAYYWIPLQSLYAPPRIYPGDNLQMPDPGIQALEGTQLTPAYRGLCYAMFANFYLFNFADRIPSFRAEVSYSKVPNTL